MNRSRELILARLRQAERTARLPRAPAEMPRHIEFANPSPQDSLERFRKEATSLGVETFVEDSADAVRARIKALVADRRVFSWDPQLLPYDLGANLDNFVLARDRREKQAAADIGLTGCAGAIAETGTLAMLSEKGKSRAGCLLPGVHIAVVRRNDLCFSMSEFLDKNSANLRAASSCSFITGPSRTADIELTLTVGVHGPGRVIVVIGP